MFNREEDLEGLEELLKLLDEMRGMLKTTLPLAIRAGELLTNIKANLAYGEWGKWCKLNLLISERQANRFMQCYKNRDLLRSSDRMSELSLCDAYRLLPHKPDKPPKPKAKSRSETTLSDKTWGKIEHLRETFPGSSDGEIIMACVEGTYKMVAPTTQSSPKVYVLGDNKVPDLEEIRKKVTSLTNKVASASNWIKNGKPLLVLDTGIYSRPLRSAMEKLIQELKGFDTVLSRSEPIDHESVKSAA